MPEKDKIKVVIIEDDDLIRESYVALITSDKQLDCRGNYSNCEEAIKNLNDDIPDVINAT